MSNTLRTEVQYYEQDPADEVWVLENGILTKLEVPDGDDTEGE